MRILNKDASETYIGRDCEITNPWKSQLIEFAMTYGFDTEDEAILNPVSILRDGAAVHARIVKIEI